MVKSKSKRFKSAHSAAEPLVVALPKEMWIRIWDYLDYETLQKKCTRVSRKWFEDIRNSARLSGKLTLKTCRGRKKIDDLSAEDINSILDSWKMLKILHVPSEMAIAQIGINLNAHTLLRKIVVPKRVPVSMKELGNWGRISEVCFDPKQGWAPITLENVAGLEIQILHVKEIPEDFFNGDICQRVEALTLMDFCQHKNTRCNIEQDWPLLITNFLESESISSLHLKSLTMNLSYLNISQLPKVLEIIETKKNLNISAIIDVDSNEPNFDHERFGDVDGYFMYARDFIDEKLPIESTEIKIKETWRSRTWYLKKTKGRSAEIYEGEWSNDW